MSGGGPSFDDRLAVLAIRLAASIDVRTVVSVRGEVVALIATSLKAHPEDRALRHGRGS